MQSGDPHGQGGICPTSQQQSYVYETPALVYCADGMQTNMVTSQYPGELAVAYCLDQTLHGLTRTRQRFHRLGHRQTPGGPHNPKPLSFSDCISSTAVKGNGTGLEEHCSGLESKYERTHPLLYALLKEESQTFDTIQGLINTRSSLSAKMNANSEHISSYFQDERHNKSPQTQCTLASINCGQTSKHNLDHLGVDVTHHQRQFHSPHLHGSLPNTPPTDEQILDFIEKRLAHYRSASNQQSGKCGATPLSNMWTFSSIVGDTVLQSDCNVPKSNCVIRLSATPQSKGKGQGLPFSMPEKYTARGGHAFTEEGSKSRSDDIAFTFQSKVAADCATVASDKQSTEYPQIMRNIAARCTKNEDTSPVVLAPVSGMTFQMATEKNGCSHLLNWSSTQEHVPPLLNIGKNLDDLDKVPGVSWALKSTVEMGKGGSDPKAVATVRMDGVKDVADAPVAFQTKSISLASGNDTFQLKSLITKDARAEKGQNNVDARFQITCKEVMAHSKLNSSIQIQSILSIPANQSCEDAHSVYLQRELGVTLSKIKVKESALDQKLHSVTYLKDPQYEDISDDEGRSQQTMKRTCIEDLHYEAISEAEEPQIQNIAEKHPSLTQVPQNNIEQSTYGYVVNQTLDVVLEEEPIPKNQVSSNTGMVHVAQQSSSIACTGFAERDDWPSPNCNPKNHMGWQASQPVSYSPSCVLKDETDDQMEDDYDDNWLVIPVSMVDIQFEPDEHVGIELVMLHPGKNKFMERWTDASPKQCRLHQPAPALALPPSPSRIEVFDTFDSFVKAKGELFGFFKSTPPNGLDPDAEPHYAQSRSESHSEPDDSCETEDSCDYSSGSEHNRLTVDKRLLREMSVSAPPDVYEPLSEDETEDTGTMVQTSSALLKEMLVARSRHTVTEMSNIIILDSDNDDESDQNCKKKVKRKRLLSSGLEEGRESERDGSGPLIEAPLGFEQIKHDVSRPNVLTQQIVINLDSDTDLSGSEDGGNTRKGVQVTETREHIQQINRPRTVLPDSDRVTEKDHNRKRMPTMETIVSGSHGSSGTSSAEQNEPATQMMTRPRVTTSERPKKIMLSSKDSCDELPQPVGKNTDCADRVLVRLFVEESHQPGSYLKLSKESKSKPSKDDSITLKTSTTDRHRATISVKKPKPTFRQMSSLEQEGPSTFISNPTPSAAAQVSQVSQRSASEGSSQSVRTSVLLSLPKLKTSTSVPIQQVSSSKLKRSHSYGSASTLEHPDILTKDSSFARNRVQNNWHMSYIPTRRDRKPSPGTEEPLRTASCDSSARPPHGRKCRAPRRQHSCHKPATALMKKTRLEAIQRTKDINRATSSGQSNVMAKHYKWTEEQRPTKGDTSDAD